MRRRQIARRVGRAARPSASSTPGWACRPGSASMDAPCGPRKSASAASLPSGALARAIKGPALRPLMLPLTVMRMERFHLHGSSPDTGGNLLRWQRLFSTRAALRRLSAHFAGVCPHGGPPCPSKGISIQRALFCRNMRTKPASFASSPYLAPRLSFSCKRLGCAGRKWKKPIFPHKHSRRFSGVRPLMGKIPAVASHIYSASRRIRTFCPPYKPSVCGVHGSGYARKPGPDRGKRTAVWRRPCAAQATRRRVWF